MYLREIGLVATSFSGTVRFFDPFFFRPTFSTANEQRAPAYRTGITCFAISEKLSVLATGGAEGKLMIIDPYAHGIVKSTLGHPEAAILDVQIFEEQQQIISIAANRTVGVWDTRLEKIQFINDAAGAVSKAYTSACFDARSGTLFACGLRINVFRPAIDEDVEVGALQTQQLSKHVLQAR